MTKPACKDCFWWVKNKTDVKTIKTTTNDWKNPLDVRVVALSGFCHLRPPISGKQPWPQALPDDFCRCFKDKEDVE